MSRLAYTLVFLWGACLTLSVWGLTVESARARTAAFAEVRARTCCEAAEREQNITRAVVRRDDYRDGMDRLRPWMEHDPACTVAEALRREAAARAMLEATTEVVP